MVSARPQAVSHNQPEHEQEEPCAERETRQMRTAKHTLRSRWLTPTE